MPNWPTLPNRIYMNTIEQDLKYLLEENERLIKRIRDLDQENKKLKEIIKKLESK